MKFQKRLICGLALALVMVTAGTAMAETSQNTKKKARKSTDRISSSYAASSGSSEAGLTGRSAFSGILVRPILAYQFMNPSSLNSTAQKLVDGNNGINVGNSHAWGLAIDYPVVNNRFYAGIRLEHFSASSDAVAITKADGAKGNATSSVSGTPLMLTGTYLYPVANKINIGASAGAGLCLGYASNVEVEGSTSGFLPNGTLGYAATPFVGQLTVLGTYDITRTVALRLEAGYRLLSSSQMRATDNYASRVKSDEVMTDADGKNISVDASGVYTGLSLSIRL